MEVVEFRQYTIKRRFGGLLFRMLPPEMFHFVRLMVQSVRYRWWYLLSYLPRLVTSWFLKRTPQVRGFGAARTPTDLAKQLQTVNALAATKMCRIMTKYGSDKGRLNKYTPVYSALFKERYDQPLRIFELGLGTNDPDAPSNMGVFGFPGASLRAWRNLFPRALVYGADIDRRVLFQEERIKTFYCDQLDPASIRELWMHPDLQGGVDVIIEDGLHTFESNVSFLEGSLDHLRPGGIYITEDIIWYDDDKWYDRLETLYSKQYPTYEFAYVVVPNGPGNLVVIRRGVE